MSAGKNFCRPKVTIFDYVTKIFADNDFGDLASQLGFIF